MVWGMIIIRVPVVHWIVYLKAYAPAASPHCKTSSLQDLWLRVCTTCDFQKQRKQEWMHTKQVRLLSDAFLVLDCMLIGFILVPIGTLLVIFATWSPWGSA